MPPRGFDAEAAFFQFLPSPAGRGRSRSDRVRGQYRRIYAIFVIAAPEWRGELAATPVNLTHHQIRRRYLPGGGAATVMP